MDIVLDFFKHEELINFFPPFFEFYLKFNYNDIVKKMLSKIRRDGGIRKKDREEG